jgi:hypothetical protein
MKHIPIMLALALSISLSSFDENMTTSSNNTNITEATAITMNIIDSDDSSELSIVEVE